ncbi:MAG TPA: Sec-independent protein translocase subunit TatA [Humibacillus sp.]|nr:Sec-independent protein translocase subunit TatA [Humibacillus sp.]
MADLGWPELSIIVIAFVLLFGWKRMPDMARSLGRSARIFKSEVDQLRTDSSDARDSSDASESAPPSPTPVPNAAEPGPRAVAQPGSLAAAEARAAAAEAELTRRRADAEVARLRAERQALGGMADSH